MELVETASALGGPTILVLTTFAIFFKKGDARNAICSIVVSMVTWVFAHHIVHAEAPVIYTVLSGVIGYLLPLPWTKDAKILESTEEEMSV